MILPKNKKEYLLLVLILVVATIVRLENAFEYFDFSHDGDLYSWIFKDIFINHHLRLIGQLTSTPGIFIGPFFYYLIIPFFLLTNLEPLGVVYLGLMLGFVTTFSFYWIFKKIWDYQTGLIAASLHGFLLQRINYDRWIVPTITTSLWEVWYFYSVVNLVKGNFNVLFLLGLLVGLIWHINFALVPSLIAIPIALILSKKIPKIKQLILGIFGFLIPSIPLILFEVKHGFMQTRSFLAQAGVDQFGGTGFKKFILVIFQVAGNAYQLLFYPDRGQIVYKLSEKLFGANFSPMIYVFVPINGIVFSVFLLCFLLIISSGFFLVAKKIISYKLLGVLYVWIAGMVIYFSYSSKIISEYYFTNINMVTVSLLILLLAYLYKKSKIGQKIVVLLIIFLGLRSIYFFAYQVPYNNLGYQERKEAVDFVTEDSKKHNYPCVAISYVSKAGLGYGFRYLLYLSKLHISKYDSGAPLYSIVIPESIVQDSRMVRFKAIGVIPEGTNKSKEQLEQICQVPDYNLEGDLFGYTQ